MNEPSQQAPARGARPQLFAATSGNSTRRPQPDFGPSILSTIDSRQARLTTARDRFRLRRLLWLGLLVLAVVAAYVGVRLGLGSSAAAREHSQVVAVVSPGPTPQSTTPVQAIEPVVPASASQGTATIETVATQPAPVAVASSPQAVASPGRIQQALEQATEPQRPSAPEAAAKPGPRPTAKPRQSEPVAASPTKATVKAPGGDADAELLAAMLPHLRRTKAAGSPALDKRCGQLSGEAAAECRAKFCSERQAQDAACPAAATQR